MERYIAYREDENNYYDDSDFYIMILDTKEEKIIKHVYGSTRFAGGIDFPHKYLDLTKDEKRFEIEEKAIEIAFNDFDIDDTILSSGNTFPVEVGDIVRVTNPRARKFKGETFEVEEMKEWKLRYGFVGSTTLIGGGVKTNLDNVTVVKHNTEKLKRKAFRKAVGLRVN